MCSLTFPRPSPAPTFATTAHLDARLAMPPTHQNVLASREGDGEEDSGGAQDAEERMMQQQREEYGRRGIHLTYFEKGTSTPHFINLDEDPFRSHRFMYLLEKVRGPITDANMKTARRLHYGVKGAGVG